MSVADLSPTAWVLLAVGAFLVGVAKTAIGGLGTLAVVAFAAAVSAKESTGALLPLLLAGDLVAVRVYHRHADWSMLLRLLPGVVPGLVVGAWFLTVADDAVVRRSIGAICLVMGLVQLWSRWRGARQATATGGATNLAMGGVAGFATMTANAAGPVTTLYLLRAGMPMLQMLGTVSWFYLVVNALKVPFSAGASLITGPSLLVDAILLPALLVGAVVGVRVVRRLDQASFETALLALTLVSAVFLVL